MIQDAYCVQISTLKFAPHALILSTWLLVQDILQEYASHATVPATVKLVIVICQQHAPHASQAALFNLLLYPASLAIAAAILVMLLIKISVPHVYLD